MVSNNLIAKNVYPFITYEYINKGRRQMEKWNAVLQTNLLKMSFIFSVIRRIINLKFI